MYENSKKDSEFYDLIELMKNEQTIITAIHNIKSNKGSKTAGIDKVDINKYLQMEPEKLIRLIKESIDDYQPSPVRRVYIPKKNGKLRPLGIPTMIDRIIQEITRIVLEPIMEAKFFNHSYGFRPYRSPEHAIARVVHIATTTNCHYVVEGDIKSFFDNVNHNKLLGMMWGLGIKDQRLLSMVKKMLRAGVMEDITRSDTVIGTPQGGIISPLLANIYLHSFDKFIAKQYEDHKYLETYAKNSKSKNPKVALDNGRKSVKRYHKQKYLVRYADDWVIITESKEEAERMLHLSKKFFKHRLSLELSEEKTMITDMNVDKVKFLGFELFMENKRFKDKPVCKVIPNREAFQAKTREILNKVEAIRYQETPHKVAIEVEKLNSMIVGVTNYYQISMAKHMFQRLDNVIYYTALKSVRKLYRSGKDRLIRISEVNNRTLRHAGYKQKTFYFDYEDMKIGITKAVITPIEYARRFNPLMTPYTPEGREIRRKTSKKTFRKHRPLLYNPDELLRIIGNNQKNKRHYTFEYVMNREYAYNRDSGKCVTCKTEVYTGNIHCHHKRIKLPKKLINKVHNLTTLCMECHTMVHSSEFTKNKKILELRHILEVENK